MSEGDIIDHVVVWPSLLALFMFMAVLIWCIESITLLREKRDATREIIDDIDTTTSLFGFGRPPEGTILGGPATPTEAAVPLRAPLSQRLCLAYRIELGYPEGEDFVSLRALSSDHDSIPLLVHDLRVSLGEHFRFTPSSDHRMAFRLDELPPLPDDSRCKLIYEYQRERRLIPVHKGRLYEWIIPPDEAVEIVNLSPLPPATAYRTAELELERPWIHAGPRDDEAILDRLRRTRAAAIHQLERCRRNLRVPIPVMLLVQAYAVWIIWSLWSEI